MVTLLEELEASSDAVKVYLQGGYDLDGKKQPMESYARIGGTPRRVKAVIQADQRTFRNYYQKDDGEWSEYTEDEEDWYVRGVGSSEIMDFDGDRMQKSALNRMTEVQPGMSTWMDHVTDDDHMFGSLLSSPTLVYREPDNREMFPQNKATSTYAGIVIESDVERDNEYAVRRYRYMKKGRKYGWSVGCFYTEYKKRIEKGKVLGVDVFDLVIAEWSIVPFPNNQQSWVDATHKAMVAKGILLAGSLGSAENLYRLKSGDFDQFGPVVGPRLLQLADYMATAGLYICTDGPASTLRSAS